jgi:hypothetical protein
MNYVSVYENVSEKCLKYINKIKSIKTETIVKIKKTKDLTNNKISLIKNKYNNVKDYIKHMIFKSKSYVYMRLNNFYTYWWNNYDKIK